MPSQFAPSVLGPLPQELAAYRLLTSDQAALLLGVPVATLRTWRSRRRGYGPRAVQGGSVRYRLAHNLAWIDDHTETDDGELREGVEASKRGESSPTDPAALTRTRRPARVEREPIPDPPAS